MRWRRSAGRWPRREPELWYNERHAENLDGPAGARAGRLLGSPRPLDAGRAGESLRLSLISNAGWSKPRRLRLSAAEVADLARAAAAARPADLPGNLYSSSYQDLQIGVLNRTKSVQSRQFAKMTPQTHGEKQERFDKLVAVLEALKTRVGAP